MHKTDGSVYCYHWFWCPLITFSSACSPSHRAVVEGEVVALEKGVIAFETDYCSFSIVFVGCTLITYSSTFSPARASWLKAKTVVPLSPRPKTCKLGLSCQRDDHFSCALQRSPGIEPLVQRSLCNTVTDVPTVRPRPVRQPEALLSVKRGSRCTAVSRNIREARARGRGGELNLLLRELV